MAYLPLFFVAFATVFDVHVPHDDVHGIATADISGGIRETVITTQAANRVLRTRNNGLTWETVHGDGLELAMADLVVWDAHPSGQRFLIGTNLGIWAYDPLTEQVSEVNSGLDLGAHRFSGGMIAPAPGSDGPVLMVNLAGYVFSLNRSTDTWEELLNSGLEDARPQVAMNPHFDAAGPTGPGQGVAVGISGTLFLSDDGGSNWSIHPQFSTPSTLPTDPLITAISYSDDYEVSGIMTLGTSVENLANLTEDEGTLWQTGDFATNFNAVLSADSSFRCIQATPPAPSGNRMFLAAVLEHPDFDDLDNSEGIYRSMDGGLTWDDFGTAQDFIHENDAAHTVSLERGKILDFEFSPTFSSDGEILFGRSEGLFRTRDEGLHWTRIPFRTTTHIRGLDSFVDESGDLWAVAATYGSGTIVSNVTQRFSLLLDEGPMNYQDELAMSPNFVEDGTFMVGGSRGLSFWFDPELQAANPHNVWGWKSLPTSLGLGYARFVAFSPHFDARGGSGTDQTLFFSTSTHMKVNIRSSDGGVTGTVLDKLADGSPVPWLRSLVVAQTYDASTSAGRTDVYGSIGAELFRLHDRRWRHAASLANVIESIALAPDFDRNSSTPGRPLVFFSMKKFPYFGILEDKGSSSAVAYYSTGLEEGSVIKGQSASEGTFPKLESVSGSDLNLTVVQSSKKKLIASAKKFSAITLYTLSLAAL